MNVEQDTLAKSETIRHGWIKSMYIYTIIAAGGFGLGIIFIPNIMRSLFSWPNQDSIVFGVTGSVYLSFALLSIFGLRSPLSSAITTFL